MLGGISHFKAPNQAPAVPLPAKAQVTPCRSFSEVSADLAVPVPFMSQSICTECCSTLYWAPCELLTLPYFWPRSGPSPDRVDLGDINPTLSFGSGPPARGSRAGPGPSLPPTVLGAAGRPHLILSTLAPSRTPVWSLCAPPREWRWHTRCCRGWGTKENSARAGCSVISIVCSHHYFCWTESSSRKAEKTGSCRGWGKTGEGAGRTWTLCPLSSSLLPRALHGLRTHAQGPAVGARAAVLILGAQASGHKGGVRVQVLGLSRGACEQQDGSKSPGSQKSSGSWDCPKSEEAKTR